MESLRFEGVEALDADMLRDSIATRETRCRAFILKPLCAVANVGIFVEKHDLDREELRLDEIRIRVVYFRRGYRQARVESSLEPEEDGVAVVFSVDEGPLTRVGELTVEHTDSVLPAGELHPAVLPDEGGPLDLIRLDSARIQLRTRLWDRGYADAEVRDSVVIPDATPRLARVYLRVDPGPRTTIGEIVLEGNEGVSDATLLRMFALEPGDLYRRADMSRAQRRLYETELFRQSVIRVPETTDSAKTVVVTVREAPPRALRVSPGFNTIEFVQGEVRFTRHNFLGGAKRLDVRGAVGNILAPQLYGKSIFGSAVPAGVGDDVDAAFLRPTWYAGVNLTHPFFLSAQNSLGVGVSAHRRTIPGIVVDRGVSANASVTRRVAGFVPVSLSYQFEQTRVEAGDVYFCVSFGVCDPPTVASLSEPHRLSPLRLSARVDLSDDPLAPSSGWTARLELEHASQLTLSDFEHQRVTGEVAHYRGLGRGVLAGRVRAGWVRPLGGTLGGDLLHPRRRLLAGGSRSVRGYGENQLGPRVLTVPAERLLRPEDPDVEGCTEASLADGTCDPEVAASNDGFEPQPLGGNTLLEGSLEYRHPLTETITGALFVDAGTLRGGMQNLRASGRTAVTPGIGIRYDSPVGPVRLDLGVRPSIVEELPVVTAVETADGESRLVLLDTRRRWDPVGGGGGFLRQVLSRLQLHLAIGEAF